MDKDNLHLPKVDILSWDKSGRATYMGDLLLVFKVRVVVGPYAEGQLVKVEQM
jgi:hypothetical protein